MPSGESDVAPLIAEDVALPSRGGFFDLANFLLNPEVRKACEDRDSILVGGDASGELQTKGARRIFSGSVSRPQLLDLCCRLDGAYILELLPLDDAEDISSVSANRKKFDAKTARWRLRLLFHWRVRKFWERHLQQTSRRLPHAACFVDFQC